jgi:homoserine dehydrogenase
MERKPHGDPSIPSADPIRVGLLGCGTVGSEVARLLQDEHSGALLERVAVRDIDKNRPVHFDAHELTDDAFRIVKDPSIDVVIELIGGIHPALELIRQSLVEGKHVVTANKAVIARHGPLLESLAAERGVSLLYEGAVCAAIPVLRVLRGSAQEDRVRSICGVLNGTTNFVLGQIERGRSFDQAVELAQTNGFAEADTSADIDGVDAAAKLAILASHAFRAEVPCDSIQRVGIRGISGERVRACLASGRRLKLVGTAIAGPDGSVSAFVAPVALPIDHPLARLEGAENGVVLETECAGTLSFFGEGAGGRPTAASVMADLDEIVRGSTSRRPLLLTSDERRAV